jgi:hypothetical protein
MSFSIRTADLAKLNALTRYPSILTYHPLDPKQSRSRGKQADVRPLVRFAGSVLITEKVDGVNARLVVAPDGAYLIGSREEFLYARGDLLANPAMSIVATVRPFAERVAEQACDPGSIVVCYGEVYGGKVTDGSRQYTGEQRLGFRLFDVAVVADWDAHVARPVEQIGAWREGGGQRFVPEETLQRLAGLCGLSTTPRLETVASEDLPQTIDDALEFLAEVAPRSQAVLDGSAGGRAEGVVLRTPDRSTISKLRFKDYEAFGHRPRKR